MAFPKPVTRGGIRPIALMLEIYGLLTPGERAVLWFLIDMLKLGELDNFGAPWQDEDDEEWDVA